MLALPEGILLLQEVPKARLETRDHHKRACVRE